MQLAFPSPTAAVWASLRHRGASESRIAAPENLTSAKHWPTPSSPPVDAPPGSRWNPCWHSGQLSFEQYQAAIDVEPVHGESEARGRDPSAGELRGLLEASARAPSGLGTDRTRRPDAAATLLS